MEIKHVLSLCAAAFAIMLLVGCRRVGSGDAEKDGREMMYESMTALMHGDSVRADSVIKVYVDYYKDKSLEVRTQFVNGSSQDYWNEIARDSMKTPEWREFLNRMAPVVQWYVTTGVSIQDCPHWEELNHLRQRTRFGY